MTLRSILCLCGTRRPGSEARCPTCGRSEGRELLERSLVPPEPIRRPRGTPTGDKVGCGLCGLARVRSPQGALMLCPFCDTVRDID